MKKMKGVASMAPPPFADPTTRFKHHSLIQDYHELKKETEVVKETLERAKQKKLTLLAEVRFLRRRHKYLVKKQSLNPQPKRDLVQTQKPEVQSRNNVKRRNYSAKEATSQHPVPGMDLNQKGKSYNVREASLRHPGSGFDLNQGKFNCGKDAALRSSALAIDLNVKDRTYSGKEAVMRNTTLVFDLNQISREDEEELNGGPLRFEEPRKSSIRIANEEQQNDMKLSVCRNVGSGTSRAGKRKITWQDQVALRV